MREGWTCCLSMLLPSMESSQPQRRHRTHLSATALCCFRTSASVAHRHAEINTVKWSVFGYFNNFLKKKTFFPKRHVSYKNSLPEKKLISLAIFFFDSKKTQVTVSVWQRNTCDSFGIVPIVNRERKIQNEKSHVN